MKTMKLLMKPLASTLAAAALLMSTVTPALADPALQAAIAAPHRTPAFVARDVWRHPYETLTFFGIQPGMTVVEISPGGGWYTEILAPYLRSSGKLILAGDDPESDKAYARRGAERMAKKLAAQPEIYDKVTVSVFAPPAKVSYVPAGTADMVLTFRNAHNWAAGGDAVTRAAFKSAFDALKPGGIFGVVDHRLPAARPLDPKFDSGYVHSALVVQWAQNAGFKLLAQSEINANPKDTADHENGVWALPPTLANKDKDRARYAAIGESDRMTLKFIKP